MKELGIVGRQAAALAAVILFITLVSRLAPAEGEAARRTAQSPVHPAVATESPPPSPQLDPAVLAGKVIALDAGHGGKEPGAFNAPYDLTEKGINMQVVLYLKGKLEAAGARVVLTRTEDVYMDRTSRVAIANASGAQALVSVHHNHGRPGAEGIETFYSQADDLPLAQAMYDALARTFPALPLRGVKRSNFTMTLRPNMPSTLTEAYFLSNDDRASGYGSEALPEREAQALYEGLIVYFGGLRPPA